VLLGGGLALAAVPVLSGCTVGGRPEPLPPVHEPTPGVDPDVVIAGDTLSAEQAMLHRLEAAMARHQGLRPLLAPVAAVHQAHAALLTQAVPGSASPSPSDSFSASGSPSGSASAATSSPASPDPTPSATASAGPAQAAPEVPRKPDRTLRWLAGHESDLSLFDKQQAFTARSGAFARLLASMAAAAAQQAVLLGHREHRHGAAR